MKPERALVAERPAAQHCTELVRVGPAADELMPRLTQAGERFAKTLAPRLAPFVGGEIPRIKVHPARQDDDLMFGAEIGGLAANSLYAIGASEVPLLVSLNAGAILGIVDRTFGGRGLAPDPLPERLPLSAELMIERLEDSIVTSLTEALELPDPALVRLLRRDGSLQSLGAYPDGASLAVVKIDIIEEGRPAWPAYLCLPEALLPKLFGGPAALTPKPVREPADPLRDPFAALPIELSAVLVDMRISMAAIAAIEPGTILPVAVARAVPLRIGDQTIATGTVGAADDRVAIRINQAFA